MGLQTRRGNWGRDVIQDSSMRLFLGVDGGQSATIAIAGDETGKVIGIGRSGPCNHAKTGEGRERFLRAIAESVHAAAGDAEFECVCLGLSGGPDDKEALAREAIRAHHYLVTHDAAVALTGALAGEPGIITIAGTGSIAYGRNAEGRTVRAGGWGYIFGDDGSAFGVVRRALRAVLRYEEGWGPKTRLRETLLAATGAPTANDLLHLFYTDEYPRWRIASFAKVVDETAAAGDNLATEILNDAAQYLAMTVSAARAQLFAPGERYKVSYAGGMFRSSILLERFDTLVGFGDCQIVAPKYGPAAGALLEAYRSCGLTCQLTGAPDEKAAAKS